MPNRNYVIPLSLLAAVLHAAPAPAQQPPALPALATAVLVTTMPAAAPFASVLFENNSTRIDQTLWPMLRTAAALAATNPDIVIELEGHADVRGSRNDNHTLSFKRVQAVTAFLVRHGADASRIRAVGFGETRASANINDRTGQTFDRRVTISFVTEQRAA